MAATSGAVPPGWTANPSRWAHRAPIAAAAAAGLVTYQAAGVGAFCALCLASAGISIALVVPATAEARASLGHLAREGRRGTSAWLALWGLGARRAHASAWPWDMAPREREEHERGRPENPSGAEQDARVDRQDATGIDVPAGHAAKDVRPEQYRPTEILDDDEPVGDSGDAERGRS